MRALAALYKQKYQRKRLKDRKRRVGIRAGEKTELIVFNFHTVYVASDECEHYERRGIVSGCISSSYSLCLCRTRCLFFFL